MDEPIDEEWWPPHTQRSERHCPICLQLECICQEPPESLQVTIPEDAVELESGNHWDERKDLD
jgi:hypothetical protein